MLNKVKVPTLEVNVCSECCKPLLPPRDDIRLFVHAHKVAFVVAKVVPQVVYAVHSHVSDRAHQKEVLKGQEFICFFNCKS